MRCALLLFLLACDAAPAPDPAVGALVPPAGWTGHGGTFRDPEHQVRVVVRASEHLDPRLAIAEAWLAAAPAMLVQQGELDEPPPDDGWDAHATMTYASGARAIWRRLGPRSYVVLADGDPAALAKREAQVATLAGALRPAGLRTETLSTVRRLEPAKLDAFIERARAELSVPGAAVAVIHAGNVVYERTFGVRARGDVAQVTRDTLFLLGSTTKPMTTLMQAALVDRGVVRWDTPVTQLLPDFALGDPAVTRELVLWQMGCACTGMPRQDMEGLFEWEHVTAEARLAMMRTMRPTTKVGETFQYSNLMVAAGGYAAAHAVSPIESLGYAYAKVMRQMVFDPIGMTSSTLDFATVAASEHAVPHALSIDGITVAMPLAIERAVEPIAPAGGVWSTLNDMVRYALTELAEGVAPSGARVASVASYRERTKLRVRSGDKDGYGVGLHVGTYRGQRVLSHDGGSFGFGTTLFLLPDAGVGIVILTNVRNGNAKEQLPFNAAVTRAIVEALYAEALPRADRQLAYYVAQRRPPRYVRSADRAGIDELAGRYREPVLGALGLRGDVLDAGEWRSRVDRAGDRLVLLDPPFAGAALGIGPGPTIIVPDEQRTYTFVRE